MPTLKSPIRRRNPVAKSLRRIRGGPHRTGPTRADLKHELRRQIEREHGHESAARRSRHGSQASDT